MTDANKHCETSEFTTIPGLRQDHKGNCYQLQRDNKTGTLLQVAAQEPELEARATAALQRVLVVSKSQLPLEEMNERAMQQLMQGRWYRKGETFISLVCYQGATMEL